MVERPLPAICIEDGLSATVVQKLTECLSSVAGPVTSAPDHPVIAPAMLLGHPALSEIARMMRPEQDMSLVHESQSFTRTGTVPSKIPLTVSATIKESGASKVLNFSLQEENGAALGSMQTRLRTVTAAEMVRFKGSAFPDHMDKGDVIWLWSDPFSKSTVQAYLTLACDPNPIHRSDEQAKLAGLPGAVVPGMLFAGVAEFMLARALPGGAVKSMKMRFMAPVLIGEALQYGVLPRKTGNDGRPKTVRIFVVRSDKMIAAIADLDL